MRLNQHNNLVNKTYDITNQLNTVFSVKCSFCNKVYLYYSQDRILIGKRFGAYHVKCKFCRKIYYIAGTTAELQKYMGQNYTYKGLWPEDWKYYEKFNEPKGISMQEKIQLEYIRFCERFNRMVEF